MNSIPFAGQALGALLSEKVSESLGYKWGLISVSAFQLVGVISEYLVIFSAVSMLQSAHPSSFAHLQPYAIVGPIHSRTFHRIYIYGHRRDGCNKLPGRNQSDTVPRSGGGIYGLVCMYFQFSSAKARGHWSRRGADLYFRMQLETFGVRLYPWS